MSSLASRLQRASWLVLLACVGLAGASGTLLSGCADPATSSARAGEFPDEWFFYGSKRPGALRNLEGQPAPEIAATDWIGDPHTIASLRGKVVVLDIWATWCGPCVRAIPHNVSMVNAHGDAGLVIIGVHDAKAGAERMPKMAQDQGINYPLCVDEGGDTVRAYNVTFFPTYVAIDRKGVVRAAGLLPDRVDEVITRLLAEQA